MSLLVSNICSQQLCKIFLFSVFALLTMQAPVKAESNVSQVHICSKLNGMEAGRCFAKVSLDGAFETDIAQYTISKPSSETERFQNIFVSAFSLNYDEKMYDVMNEQIDSGCDSTDQLLCTLIQSLSSFERGRLKLCRVPIGSNTSLHVTNNPITDMSFSIILNERIRLLSSKREEISKDFFAVSSSVASRLTADWLIASQDITELSKTTYSEGNYFDCIIRNSDLYMRDRDKNFEMLGIKEDLSIVTSVFSLANALSPSSTEELEAYKIEFGVERFDRYYLDIQDKFEFAPVLKDDFFENRDAFLAYKKILSSCRADSCATANNILQAHQPNKFECDWRFLLAYSFFPMTEVKSSPGYSKCLKG